MASDDPHVSRPPEVTSAVDGQGPGWQEVPVHDPQVKNAANQALKTIQERSNSLFPYQLQEISHAKAEVVDDFAKFNLVLKVKRGNKEEKFNVEVHTNNEGNFILNQMDEYKPGSQS
ncbi:hypothetical protein Nepgr_017304 [Nepenthes gracilis]|uniref:Cysteine proteinase inhibitor n=1 Tax=Nepenthes gracilis TaxID=150966 RepID=A0AAD3XSD0_NEPGR|nr:hypothetical protein Nepgr_017304 [Nepenthes gracilis]